MAKRVTWHCGVYDPPVGRPLPVSKAARRRDRLVERILAKMEEKQKEQDAWKRQLREMRR